MGSLYVCLVHGEISAAENFKRKLESECDVTARLTRPGLKLDLEKLPDIQNR